MAKASRKVRLSGDFDGGNPKSASRIREEGGNVFTVTPTWEQNEGDLFGLAFAVTVQNPGTKAARVTVHVDWTTPEHMQYKGYYYLNQDGDDDWEELKASDEGAVATVSFDAEPGASTLSLTPMYNYSAYLAFADALGERPDVQSELAGKSKHGREIWRIQIPAKVYASGEPVFFMARTNAGESSGSFMIEGMARFLLSGEREALELLKRYTFHFLPMTNPDGVFEGLERGTAAKNGARLARMNTVEDPAHDAIRQSLELVKPAVFVNLHNWVMNDVDGLLCNDEVYANRLSDLLPAVGKYPRRWHREWYSDKIAEVEEHGDATLYPIAKLGELHKESGGTWKDFCRERFGARAMAMEFPWRGRSVDDMRNLGAALLRAVCAIRNDEREKRP